MSKVTSVRLSNHATTQLESLAVMTGKTKTEIINAAILQYSSSSVSLADRVSIIETTLEALKDIIARTPSPTTPPESEPEPEPEITEADCEWLWTDGLSLSRSQRDCVAIARYDHLNPREILEEPERSQFDPDAKPYLAYKGRALTGEATNMLVGEGSIKQSQIAKYCKK